jgi:hypothetical protein
MKRIFTLIALFSISSLGAFAQFDFFQQKTASASGIIPIGGNAVAWDAPTPAKISSSNSVYVSTAPTFPANSQYSDFLTASDFGFTIPTGATNIAIEVRITRKARGEDIRDNRLQLISGGGLVGVDQANTSNAWGPTNQNANYDGNGDPLWGTTITPAEINDPSFGIALVVAKYTGFISLSDFADVDMVRVTIFYTFIFPIVLTNFDVKNVDNKVSISFTTESETKVKTLFIERSSDGKNYTDLFAIQPKGGENIKTTYNLTDAAPLLGTNYYRLKEIDIDGKWHYYETRVIKTTSVNAKFQAYQNNGNVIVNFNNQPGNYTLSLVDMNGAIVATQAFKVNKQAVQLTLNPPVRRTGIYIVNLKGGDNFSESLKLFIQK